MNPDALGIIDPIHGFVRAYETEQKLILNPAFQRLRRIRQLSSTHLVYPGAQHTRFEKAFAGRNAGNVAGMAGHALDEDSDLSKVLPCQSRPSFPTHDSFSPLAKPYTRFEW